MDPVMNLVMDLHSADASDQQREWSRVIAELRELRRTRRNYRIGVALAILFMLMAAFSRAATLDVSRGGTIVLQANVTYDNVTGLIPPYSSLPANTSLVCDNGVAIIAYASNQGPAFKSVSKGATFRGLRFTRGGLFLEGDGLISATVTRCEFATSATVGPKLCGLELSGMLDHGTIAWNLFAPTNGKFGLYTDTGLCDSTIANNEFVNGGMHLANTLHRNVIEQNYFHGIKNQAIEIQVGVAGSGNVIQDNWVQNNVLSPAFHDNDSAYSYSLPMEKAVGTIIRRNVSIQPLRKDSPDGCGVRIIFELGGANFAATDNLSIGGNDVCAVNGAGATGVVSRNTFASYDHMTGNNAANGARAQIGLNGPNVVTLGADGNPMDLIARGPAGRSKRLGEPVPSPPVVQPATLPATAPATAPTITGVETTITYSDGSVKTLKP